MQSPLVYWFGGRLISYPTAQHARKMPSPNRCLQSGRHSPSGCARFQSCLVYTAPETGLAMATGRRLRQQRKAQVRTADIDSGPVFYSRRSSSAVAISTPSRSAVSLFLSVGGAKCSLEFWNRERAGSNRGSSHRIFCSGGRGNSWNGKCFSYALPPRRT